jgi:hypothetical protein
VVEMSSSLSAMVILYSCETSLQRRHIGL